MRNLDSTSGALAHQLCRKMIIFDPRMSKIQAYRSFLNKEVSPASLGLFRILVSLILFIQTYGFISQDFVEKHIFDSKVRFPFSSFEFLEPLSPSGMKFIMFLMLISTVFMAFGRFFKLATGVFLLTFTYFWLLDKSYFNNHYYLISLLAVLLLFTRADAWGSFRGKSNKRAIPNWQIVVLQAQLVLVFFIAGINKISSDWLFAFQPMKHILQTKAEVSGTTWLASNFWYAFFTWSGLIFDLSIGFLLLIKRTRKLAIIAFVLFNLMNYWIFHDIGEIGIFPFLLLACLVIFLDPSTIQNRLSWISKAPPPTKDEKEKKAVLSNAAFWLLNTYIVLQFLLPFRHYLYPDHVDWSGYGQRFSWRMKIMYKDVDMHFYLVDEGSDKKLEVNVGFFLNDKQYTNLQYYPDFIPPVARYIREEGMRTGLKNPKVVADFLVGLNGRKKQHLVDPELDLTTIEFHSGKYPDWILPLSNSK